MLKLLQMLGAGIPAIISGILAWIGRKYSTAVAAIALFVFLTGVMIACINQLVGQLLGLLNVPDFVAVGLGMFLPADFATVLSVIVSSRICRASYELAMMKVKAYAASS